MAGQKINDLTGYSGIEALKREIEAQEAKLAAAKAQVIEAKTAYKSAILRRSTSQKEVNELLQRKNTWTPADLERFTSLYRSDHANEQDEIQAQNRLTEVEKEVESASGLLSKSILTRYHEEQVWSDKIRRASTWGTWMLMGVNLLLFVVVQLGLEPWKRRRLVNNFEEKVRGMLEENKIKTTTQDLVHTQTETQVSQTRDDVTDRVEDGVKEGEGVKVVEDKEESTSSTPEVTTTTVEKDGEKDTEEEKDEEAAPIDIDTAPVEDEYLGLVGTISYKLNEWFGGYFSEEEIKTDQATITAYVLEGFFAGAISMIVVVLATVFLTDVE
ncbi:hypothetical protein AA313_de0203975 [Arthrobotrys entomopaga]|nr:hypothetical protein AA313_de0203975 [Arthrobotrys entomopaga]